MGLWFEFMRWSLCDNGLHIITKIFSDFLWFLYYCWSMWCNGGVQGGQKSLWSNICIWPLQDIKLANWPRRNVKVAKLKYLCSGKYKNIPARNPFKNSNFGEERKIVAGKFNLLAPAGSEEGRWTEFTFIFYLIFHSTFFSRHRIFSKVFVIRFGIKLQTADKTFNPLRSINNLASSSFLPCHVIISTIMGLT